MFIMGSRRKRSSRDIKYLFDYGMFLLKDIEILCFFLFVCLGGIYFLCSFRIEKENINFSYKVIFY